MMILHLLSDDKFSDYVIKQFETVTPNKNSYIIIRWNSNKILSNIQCKDKIKIINGNSFEFDIVANSLNKYSAIIIHNYRLRKQYELINKAPLNVKILWVFWGSEIYNRSLNYRNFLGPITRRFEFKYRSILKFKRILGYFLLKKHINKSYEIPIEAFQRIDYCLTHVYEDYVYAKNYCKTNFGWLWYNYYNIENTVGGYSLDTINGDNILIGNSASIMNNHLEVFNMLKTIPLGERKLILPLTYGNKGRYKNKIVKVGRRLFGNLFSPILDDLNLYEYNKIIRTCSIVIMNHYRQQAMGNIITALWFGAKVFLSEKSNSYKHFRMLGIYIFSIEKDLNNNNDIFRPLDKTIINHNKKILIDNYAHKSVLKRIEDLVRVVG